MWSFIKKLFGCTKEEDRSIESEVLDILPPKKMVEDSPIVFLQSVLGYMIQEGLVKEYKCIKDFLTIDAPAPVDPSFSLDDLKDLKINAEIKLFIKKFRFLKCKTTCEEFNNWIKSVEI